MYKIGIVICYFGKLPNYFNLWLNSCKYNQTIDFLLFTDDQTEYDYPKNVKVYYVSFNEIKRKIQEKFEFKINLNEPYKLCDYKPTYGLIFNKELKEYDFWGHCDLDTIWGNLRKYLQDDILERYDKLFCNGHFSIYKNNNIINNNFKEIIDIESNQPLYKKVFQQNKSFCFDEVLGIVQLYNKGRYTMYTNKQVIADISIKYNNLIPICEKNKKYIFEFNSLNSVSKIYGYYKKEKKILKREFFYIHLQKRKMRLEEIVNKNNYLITYNGFINKKEEISISLFNHYTSKITYLRKDYIIYRIKNYIKNRRKDGKT